jgi:GNAT superfamily N-acetyltransferase
VIQKIRLTFDNAAMPFGAIHHYLSVESYWARGIPEQTLQRAMDNALCLAAIDDNNDAALAGFARVVTDRATFAYLCDVFVLPPYRGNRLAARMLEALESHPDLQGLRRWMLMTRDAHGLYAKHGFKALADATRAMERHQPHVYEKK